jgi:cytochrome c oxidase assembly factor CtaG
MLLHTDVPIAWARAPAVVAGIAIAAAVYTRGWCANRRRAPVRVSPWRLVWFLGGLGCLWAALASSIDALADVRLSAHMVQHILLLTCAPALILLGHPLLPLIRGLPGSVRRTIIGPLARQRRLRSVWHALTHPLVALLVSSAIFWVWHVPAPFQLALRVPVVHVFEHASFFIGGLVFWWPVVQPWPSRPRWPLGAMIPYLLVADVQNTVLAASLTFADRVIYPFYQTPPLATNATALGDQVLAGVLMWIPMSLAYLVPAALLTMRLLSPKSSTTRRRDHYRWPPATRDVQATL